MDARCASLVVDESGQSLFEFIFLFPFMIGMSVLLVRLNTVIQMSIVNQKYSRMTALRVVFNSAEYPSHDRATKTDWRTPLGMNQMIIGVSGKVMGAEDDLGNLRVQPEAQTYRVTRSLASPGGDDSKINNQQEPETRAHVRVRNTISLCTPSIVYYKTDGPSPDGRLKSHDMQDLALARSFAYCWSPDVLPEGKTP